MPLYFICEPGPMGGVSIIWIGEDQNTAVAMTAEFESKNRQVYLYVQVPRN